MKTQPTSTWEQEEKNFGIVPDIVIAQRLGVSRERVRQRRSRAGIEAAPTSARGEQLVRTETEEQPEIDELISLHRTRLPLSANDRQTLTNARVAMGLSQQALADLVDISLSYINQVETGKKNPSPIFMETICPVLGLEFKYEVEVRVTLTVASKRKSG